MTSIKFSTDKNGRRRAHYYGRARRWLPIAIEKAELLLATQPERYVEEQDYVAIFKARHAD